MNGRNVKPPDKGKSNETLQRNNESILNGIEIKPELDIKLEPEETDNMVTLLASERAANGSVVNLIDDKQKDDTYHFNQVCELDEAKSELKKEKTDKGAKRDSAKVSGQEDIGSSPRKDAKNYRSKQKQSKPKRGPFGSKKNKKAVATVRNKPKASICSRKKKSIVSKKAKQ